MNVRSFSVELAEKPVNSEYSFILCRVVCMPRVTEDHRKAQEERFVDAARRCFTRLGVENTSMDDIRTEAGVSAGLMYRYFGSKDDMIRAAIAGALGEFETLV